MLPKEKHMEWKRLITVFTPVYNRAQLIKKVYNSLVNQDIEKEKFEWLIVDDGSNDNLSEVVNNFIEEDIINIRYVFKPNGGVHTAWNLGVKMAQGQYFFRCDSDDEVAENALSRLAILINKFSNELVERYVGIAGLCGRKTGGTISIIGDKYPENVFISNGLEMNFKFKLKGERAGCMRTEILRQNLLPEPHDVNFIFESTMWFKIDRNYKTICINEIFKYYTENGVDSISSAIKLRRNKKYATSQLYSYSFQLNEIYDYLLLDKKYLLTILINITRRGLQAGYKISQIVGSIKKARVKILVLFFFPLGVLLFLRDKAIKR